MIFYECDGKGCSAKVEGIAQPSYGIGGLDAAPPLPPGWARIEWIEPPLPVEIFDVPDPMAVMVAAVLPPIAVEKMKKAVQAQRIAHELRQTERFEQAERRAATLCPACFVAVRSLMGRSARMGTVSVSASSMPRLSGTDVPPLGPLPPLRSGGGEGH